MIHGVSKYSREHVDAVRDASRSQAANERNTPRSTVSVHPAALRRPRDSKLMSKRDPVAFARRSSVRIEGRVRPLSRRATTG